MKFLISAIMLSTLCAGCANFTPPAAKHKMGTAGTYWLTYDASRRGTLMVIRHGEVVRSCAEPTPDIARSFANIIGSLANNGQDKRGGGAALTASVTPLSGRNDLVLLAREALFRLCEARANQDISPDRYADIFQDVLEHVKAIAEVEHVAAYHSDTEMQAPSRAEKEEATPKDIESETQPEPPTGP